ncbi:MAG: hypothetical protein IKU81_07215, partial [Oscillibacter sp.]|nr:hypothetical protein [Oscillibacter sp.]
QTIYSYDFYRVSIHLSAFQHFHHPIPFYSINTKKSAFSRLFRQAEKTADGGLFLFFCTLDSLSGYTEP